jgi:hypothetical protein
MPDEGRGPDLRQAGEVTRPRRLAQSPATPLERVRQLQTSLQPKAKAEPAFRFYSLWDKVCRADVLEEANHACRRNDGAAGCDGTTFGQIADHGAPCFLWPPVFRLAPLYCTLSSVWDCFTHRFLRSRGDNAGAGGHSRRSQPWNCCSCASERQSSVYLWAPSMINASTFAPRLAYSSASTVHTSRSLPGPTASAFSRLPRARQVVSERQVPGASALGS